MERKMRRFRQQLPAVEALQILVDGTNGILSLVNSDGAPYGVPLSYACGGDRSIYFHSAVAGHKIECIASEARCSFCVVAQDEIVPEEFTTYFRSVIVSGTITVVDNPDEVRHGLMLLCDKYSPGIDPEAEIAKCLRHVLILRLDITSITGKEAIELTRRR